MQLNLNRIFADRLVFDDKAPEKLRVANSFWDWCQRIISWIYSPASYSSENRRTISCFKKYLVDTLGGERLQKICTRYGLNLDAMEAKGSPLLSRDVAKIVIGAKNRSVGDCEVALPWTVPDVKVEITGRPTEWLARLIYDPFLADRERLELMKGHPTAPFEVFIHNMAALVIKREMDVGTLIPAPNHPDGRAQFYYVSAKIITMEGMVSYIFHPATPNSNLEPIRLFRGTSPRNSEIDGISTLITDFEKHLGKTAYESGKEYESIIEEKLGSPTIEGGHSLGSALVQYRLANMNHIKKAYLFCGPGIPAAEVEKFNQKNNEVHLVIRHSMKDRIINVGGIHLGYQAPENVHIEFCKHHLSKKESPHVSVPGKGVHRYNGMQGGMSREESDIEFHHANKLKEKVRSTLGPLLAHGLKKIRNLSRKCFSSRAKEQRGVKICSLQNGRWKVEHFR